MALGSEFHKTPIEILKALPTESGSAQDEKPILGGTFIFKAASATLRSKFLAHTNHQTVNWHDLDKEAVTTLLSQMSTQYPLLFGKTYRDWETDRKSTRLNSSHSAKSRMPSSA